MLKQSIRLKENGKIISDKKEVAEILNNHFMDSVENLEVERYLPNVAIDENLDDIDRIVSQFQDHPNNTTRPAHQSGEEVVPRLQVSLQRHKSTGSWTRIFQGTPRNGHSQSWTSV